MPYALVEDNVKIYYEIHGEGKPIALLNGIFMNTDGWILQTQALSKKYQVILHDFRGQWRSNELGKDFSLDKHSKDFKKLLEHLNIGEINLVGTSYGGLVALRFTQSYPRLVKSLVLINVPPPSSILKNSGKKWLKACQTGDPEKFVDSWIGEIYSKELLSMYGSEWKKRLVERYRNFNFTTMTILLKHQLQLLERPLPFDIKNIRVPTLIIASDKDYFNSAEAAEVFHKEVQTSEVKIIKGAGHAVIIEKSEEVNMLMLNFLDKVNNNEQR